MSSCSQQIVALDTRFNRYRSFEEAPQLNKIYLKRRLQLLSGNPKEESRSLSCACCQPSSTPKSDVRDSIGYIQLRSQILRQKCLSQGISDVSSTKSFSYTTGEIKSVSSPIHPSYHPTKSRAARRLSVSFQGDDIPTDAYDFHGLRHISDLHSSAVTQLKFAHDSRSELIGASLDGSLSVHQLDTEPPSLTHTLRAHTKGVTDFDVSTSNDLVVSCSLDGTLCLWDLGKGSLLRQVNLSQKQEILCCTFLPGNNNLVLCGTNSGLVKIVNISTGISPGSGTSTVPGMVLSLATNAQGTLVWAGTDRGIIQSFRVNCLQGKLEKGHRMVISGESPPPAKITSITSRPSPTSGKTMLLVNMAKDLLILFQVMDELGSLTPHREFNVVHRNLNLRSVFSPLLSYRSGDCVVSASEDGGVYFFHTAKSAKACINKLQAHSCPVLAVTFNYDETYLATSDSSGLIIVWKR